MGNALILCTFFLAAPDKRACSGALSLPGPGVDSIYCINKRGIHLAPAFTGSYMDDQLSVILILRPDQSSFPHNVLIRYWCGDNRLLEQSVKQHATGPGCSAIEAEDKFIQVGIQMLRLDCPVMGPQYPALHQCSYSMYASHRLMRGHVGPQHDNGLMYVA